ncbi:MAG: SGNH/GDSL hydrolase family protein [Polyangiaceae bacterium]
MRPQRSPGVARRAHLGALMCAAVVGACTTSSPPVTRPAPAGSTSTSAAATPPAPPAATAPRYRVMGRVDTRDPAAPRFAWPGTTVIVRFSGTRLTAKLRDERSKNHFQIIVDGQVHGSLPLDADKQDYVVVEGLPKGEHTVLLAKRTEAELGDVVLLGLDTDGTMLEPPPPSARRIELVGDSITAGYGNEGKGPLCPFKAETENEYDAYGAIAARALGADHLTLAWSGKTIGQVAAVYERVLPTHADSPTAASFDPQLVVINLGTNNFANGDPGELGWYNAYASLVDKVRAAHPNALIALALGPMLTDAYPLGRRSLTKARVYMRATFAKLHAKDPKIELLEFPEQKHSDGLGCNFHPSKKTHAMMAERLVAFAKEKLGW